MAYENLTTCHEMESHCLLPMWILFPSLTVLVNRRIASASETRTYISSPSSLHIPFLLSNVTCVCVCVHSHSDKQAMSHVPKNYL